MYETKVKRSTIMAKRLEIRRKTSVLAVCFACIIATIACIIIITTTLSQSEGCSVYKKQLISISSKFKALTERHEALISLAKRVNIDTTYFESSFVNGRGPPEQYEIKRRIIHSNIKDLWNYVKDTFEKLVIDIKKSNSSVENIQVQLMLNQISERKRSLLSDVHSLSAVDGYNEWRQKEASEVSDIIQRRLQFLQNPADCKTAKKVVCDVPNVCGFGCQLHYLVCCLVFAYATERTAIVQSTLWQYHSKGWGHIFEPLSNSCISIFDERVFPWHATEAKVIILPELGSIEKKHRPKFLPPAVPKDLAESLNIRDSDMVIHKEATQHDLHEYMVHVKDYYDRLELTQNVDVRRVYLASDNPKFLREAREKYTQYEFVGDESIAELAGGRKRFSPQALMGVLVDLQLLARSDLLVCTFSSNLLGRLAYALMQANRMGACNAFVSLDDVYHFWDTDRTRVAVIPHFPLAPNTHEIYIMSGDVINVTSNLWNGYGFGTNTRTNSSGLFPWFKTDENLVVYPFPEYKAEDEI